MGIIKFKNTKNKSDKNSGKSKDGKKAKPKGRVHQVLDFDADPEMALLFGDDDYINDHPELIFPKCKAYKRWADIMDSGDYVRVFVEDLNHLYEHYFKSITYVELFLKYEDYTLMSYALNEIVLQLYESGLNAEYIYLAIYICLCKGYKEAAYGFAKLGDKCIRLNKDFLNFKKLNAEYKGIGKNPLEYIAAFFHTSIERVKKCGSFTAYLDEEYVKKNMHLSTDKTNLLAEIWVNLIEYPQDAIKRIEDIRENDDLYDMACYLKGYAYELLHDYKSALAYYEVGSRYTTTEVLHSVIMREQLLNPNMSKLKLSEFVLSCDMSESLVADTFFDLALNDKIETVVIFKVLSIVIDTYKFSRKLLAATIHNISDVQKELLTRAYSLIYKYPCFAIKGFDLKNFDYPRIDESNSLILQDIEQAALCKDKEIPLEFFAKFEYALSNRLDVPYEHIHAICERKENYMLIEDLRKNAKFPYDYRALISAERVMQTSGILPVYLVYTNKPQFINKQHMCNYIKESANNADLYKLSPLFTMYEECVSMFLKLAKRYNFTDITRTNLDIQQFNDISEYFMLIYGNSYQSQCFSDKDTEYLKQLANTDESSRSAKILARINSRLDTENMVLDELSKSNAMCNEYWVNNCLTGDILRVVDCDFNRLCDFTSVYHAYYSKSDSISKLEQLTLRCLDISDNLKQFNDSRVEFYEMAGAVIDIAKCLPKGVDLEKFCSIYGANAEKAAQYKEKLLNYDSNIKLNLLKVIL